MDRGRRAEPYSNATIWTREIARNLAGHLDRLSKVHSCVDTASPKTTHLPQFHHATAQPLRRAGQVSPLKLHHATPHPRGDGTADTSVCVASPRVEVVGGFNSPNHHEQQVPSPPAGSAMRLQAKKAKAKSGSRRSQAEIHRVESLALENERLQERITRLTSAGTTAADPHAANAANDALPSPAVAKKKVSGTPQDYHKRHKQQQIWHENQALAKRLRNTKPTLSSKDWEKDDKWNQHFLKTQERRRQALHSEMTRTLASPHSALIRVKHVVGPGHGSASTHKRPGNDATADEDGDGSGKGISDTTVTAIEVTSGMDATSPKVKASRGLRRRRASNDDTASLASDSRRHSTAANHRRIMELRKQRHDDASNVESSTNEGGPTDQLLSVRFTFSREGSRGCSLACEPATPNGITGQFSPATDLETALEMAGFNDEHEWQPVPELQTPDSSRLAQEEETEYKNAGIHAAVLETLQDCIDQIASSEEEERQLSRQEDGEHDRNGVASLLATPLEQLTNIDGNDECVPCAEGTDQPVQVTELLVPEYQNKHQGPLGMLPVQVPVAYVPAADNANSVTMNGQEHTDNNVEDGVAIQAAESGAVDGELLLETTVSCIVEDSAAIEMDASGYGSEFDFDEDALPATAATAVVATVPLISEAPENDEEEESDAYEDDHADEADEADGNAHPVGSNPANSNPEDDAEPQYDDDLEPNEGDGEGEFAFEQSYSEDGFAGDD